MKKLVILALLSLILAGYSLASAALYDRGADSLGNHLIYDSGLNITWYDYTKSNNTWQYQVNWAAGLTVNFGGNTLGGWRLPTTVDGPYVFGYDGTSTVGYNITSSEMGHLYYTELGNKGYYATDGTYPQTGWGGLTNVGPFTHLKDAHYWSGTEYSLDPNCAWNFGFYKGDQGFDDKGNDFYALAVRPGDVSAVPIPGAGWLLGSGLVGLAGLKRKFKK